LSKFDIAFFSYRNHQDLLIPGLKNIIKHVPDYNEIILVWDDVAKTTPINFDQIQQQLNHSIRVIKHSELYDWPESIAHWGWIRQQLAKMLCWTYSKSEYTWICDGDVLVTGNPELFYQDLPILRTDTIPLNFKNGYYDFMKKYFCMEHLYPTVLCNGGGNCLMHNKIVEEMWQTCVGLNGKSLIECVQHEIENIDPHPFPFSEFETYGNYCLTHYPDQFYLTNHNWNFDPDRAGQGLPIHVRQNNLDEFTRAAWDQIWAQAESNTD
jgi:hypothetical protein